MSQANWVHQLGQRFRQGRSHLRSVLFPEDSEAYQTWQRSFMRRRLLLSIRIALLAYLTFIALRLTLGLLHPIHWHPSWMVMAGTSSLGLLLCLALHRTPLGRRHPGWIFLGCSWTITLVEQIWATWRGVAFPGIFAWTLVFLTQATLIPVRWHLHLIAQLGVFLYYGIVNGLLQLPAENHTWDLTLGLYLFWFCIICDLSVFLYERLQRAEFKARQELELERNKSEKLLLNILPEAVVQQLKREHRTIAEHFAEASVLFADIVGFTEMSEGVPPAAMVTLLNQIFSTFDYLAERHGLEKIKTIGDSYMVVGGLPVEQPNHLEAIADMAIDMQRAIAHFNVDREKPFTMRIGINTGPVIAGVIGVKKFIYDLWGDTVNTASRMESHGIPGAIQVTEAVYHRLRHRYAFEERGMIDVKGKGNMRVYLLKGKYGDSVGAIAAHAAGVASQL